MTDLFVRMVIPILPASLQKILKTGGGHTPKWLATVGSVGGRLNRLLWYS
jgi:hypothetical protein